MSKKLYFLPFLLFLLLCGYLFPHISSPSYLFNAFLICLPLLLSGLLLARGKWYGCFFGMALGAYVVYDSCQYHGQTVDLTSVGFVLCAYYLICGIAVYKRAKKQS